MAGASISQPIQPTNPGAIIYNAGATVDASFRKKNALFVLGRTPTNPGRIEAAAAGAIAAIYLDVTMYSNVGTYHNMFFNAGTVNGTAYGSVGSWPRGGTPGNGPPVDFTSSIAVAKYGDVLRVIKAQNPWCNAIFCDDQGPDWAGYNTKDFYQATYTGTVMTTSDKASAKSYQIALAQKARAIADELGLLLITNGEWRPDNGNGYPNTSQHGCALYDLMCIEHHDFSETYWSSSVAQGQWRLRDPNGQRAMFVISLSSQTAGWLNKANVGWLTQQTGSQYTAGTVTATAGTTAHDLGFSVSSGTPTISVSVSPNPATVQTGATQQFTATVTGTTDLPIWYVNGVRSGNSTTGTIGAGTGLYTAPAAVPTGGVVNVEARLVGGQSGSSAVTIINSAPPTPEAVLPAPPAITVRAFGNRFVGTIPNSMTPDYSRGVFINAPEAGTIQKFVVGVDGAGTGTANQPFKCALYNVDANGNPTSLIDSTAEYTITSGLAAQWVSVAFASAPSIVANTTYFVAIHSGGTEATGRFYRNETAGVSRGLADTYADGEVGAFSGAAVGNADISLYADYTPTGTVTNHMSMNVKTNLNFGFDADTVSPIGVTSVMAVLVPVTRTVPIIYEDLGDGVPGARLTWNNSSLRYEKAT